MIDQRSQRRQRRERPQTNSPTIKDCWKNSLSRIYHRRTASTSTLQCRDGLSLPLISRPPLVFVSSYRVLSSRNSPVIPVLSSLVRVVIPELNVQDGMIVWKCGCGLENSRIVGKKSFGMPDATVATRHVEPHTPRTVSGVAPHACAVACKERGDDQHRSRSTVCTVAAAAVR